MTTSTLYLGSQKMQITSCGRLTSNRGPSACLGGWITAAETSRTAAVGATRWSSARSARKIFLGSRPFAELSKLFLYRWKAYTGEGI